MTEDDEEEFARLVREEHATEEELLEAFPGLTRNSVYYLKRKLGLNTHAGGRKRKVGAEEEEGAGGPSVEELRKKFLENGEELYRMYVPQAILLLAATYTMSTYKLREHMRRVGFDPRRPVPYADVRAALRELMCTPTSHGAGHTFMASRLRYDRSSNPPHHPTLPRRATLPSHPAPRSQGGEGHHRVEAGHPEGAEGAEPRGDPQARERDQEDAAPVPHARTAVDVPHGRAREDRQGVGLLAPRRD